jgi:VIT1/CCC1 family predicted Fe2+/Mn2+ transporter
MAAGEWVSVSSQNDLIERELDVERRELRIHPESETAELAAIYERHGMGQEQAASAAAEVMRQPDIALAVHAREEFGIDPGDLPSPVGAAGWSLICFLIGAFLPLIPWFFGEGAAAAWASLAIGLVAAAVVGGLVGKFAERSIPGAITRQVLIVLVACSVTYLIGQLAGLSLN